MSGTNKETIGNDNCDHGRASPLPCSFTAGLDQIRHIIEEAVRSNLSDAIDSAIDARLSIGDGTATTIGAATGSGDGATPASTSTTTMGPGGTGSYQGGNPLAGVTCPNCQVLIPLQQPPEERWYCSIVGRKIGCIKGWARINDLTRGVSGEQKFYCTSEETARCVFHDKQQAGLTRVVNDGVTVNFTYTVDDGFLFP
ncbi:hypothetical protein E1B28_013059 [Marasmius oreades]|uniref:Uncharacterized protein n=1 Tax=Marasmius oreades TaxID=181124 RepID=A0A9P7ULJ2_9AGAR|nr:uncharacterized protein E1B28_013059 [Marasmius oreades]KAG7087077.1 hypothetical protein E1B28_013059 [Marasmius oreades]